MDLFKKERFFLPVEVMIVIAINLVMAVFGYYVVVMWGLSRG